MQPGELKNWRTKLLELREELEAVAETGDDAASTVELDQTRVGRLSRMDAMRAQAMSVEARRRRQQTLRQIEAALHRIETGDFGDCMECGEAINPRRLEFSPAVRKCIDCASRED